VLEDSNVPMAEMVVENGYRCRMLWMGRPMMVLDAMKKNLGSKGKKLRVT
jgi:hypothetical protein